VVEPGGPLRGRIRVPGDKSISHRALLIGALAAGRSVFHGLSGGDDVRRTARAVSALGATVEAGPNGTTAVSGGPVALHEAPGPINVGNSGTTIRLLAGYVARFPWLTVLFGDASVGARPMGRVVEPLRQMGADVDGRDSGRLPPLVVRGGSLHGIDLVLPVASAQVKSAVLFAGLGANGVTVVREPAPTRAHTEEMLAQAGAHIRTSDDGGVIEVEASELHPVDLEVPGDPSQAAFWTVAACVTPGSEVTVEDVYVGRARSGFIDVLRRMGADIEVVMTGDHRASVRARASELRATVVEGSEVPGLIDEIPVLAIAASAADGVTEFRDAGELVVKESDRIASLVEGLTHLGAGAEPRGDGLVVRGPAVLEGGRVRSHGDHRIAMAFAVAGLRARERVEVGGWDAVATSYPRFADDLAALRS